MACGALPCLPAASVCGCPGPLSLCDPATLAPLLTEQLLGTCFSFFLSSSHLNFSHVNNRINADLFILSISHMNVVSERPFLFWSRPNPESFYTSPWLTCFLTFLMVLIFLMLLHFTCFDFWSLDTKLVFPMREALLFCSFVYPWYLEFPEYSRYSINVCRRAE